MAVDLLSKMKDFWTSEAIQQLSVMLNEQPDRVGQALSLGAPTILAGLLKSATGTTDSHRLVDLVKHEPEEMARFGGLSGLLNHLAGLGDAVGLDPLVQYGKTALRSIFGDKLERVLNLIATDSGTKVPTAAALMGLLAPALMGMIRKETAAHGLTSESLRDFLMAQRESIAALAPGKLGETLGVRSLADLGSAPKPPVRATTFDPIPPDYKSTIHRATPVAKPRSSASWVAPVALGILALAAAYFFMLPERNKLGPDADRVGTADTNRPVDELNRGAKPAPADVARADVTAPATTGDGRPVVETGARGISLALPGDANIEVPEGSYLEAAVKMLHDGTAKTAQTFAADGLAFDQDSRLTSESAHSAEHLATIAKAFPKTKLKIEARESAGGPDDQAERKSTAQKRADAVRDALIQAGVPAERVTAEVQVEDELDTPDLTKKAADVNVVITPR